jgi:hypothetical protein
MTAPSPTPLPCAACKQPVIEKRTLDGALVVLDAATKRVHLCVKRKEADAVKAKQMAASRAKATPRPAPRPPVKRAAFVPPAESARQHRPAKQFGHDTERQRRPGRDKAVELRGKAARQRPRKTTRRSPEQVTEILKGPIVRWRTSDGPTSFCDTCGAPVLVGFSHVRWDVIMVDAAGHRAHDCEASRQAAAAQRAQPVAGGSGVAVLPEVATARRPLRTLAPVTPTAPIATADAKPRRRPAARAVAAVVTSCEACGNLKASVNGEWVCLHCGA